MPAIAPRVLLCCLFSVVVSGLATLGWPVSLPIESSIVPSLVLGLLLVFRTNTAYERFWEGRKQWGTMVNTVRNLARQMWVTIAEADPSDRQAKIMHIRLLAAFAITTKRHLRYETPTCEELARVMPTQWSDRLQDTNSPPLEVAFWIGDYLQQQHDRDRLDTYQLAGMFKLLDAMVDTLGACERILKTPIPLAYSIHLKQLLLIYCLGLPFQMVDEFGWFTAIVVGIVAFTVFGIEEIGIEIENPFGYDRNDLPLDKLCATLWINIEDLIALAPCSRRWGESDRADLNASTSPAPAIEPAPHPKAQS